MEFESRLQQLLAQAEADDLLRSPRVYDANEASVADGGVELVSFASNDYLGLAHHPELRAALAEGSRRLAGAGSSRVVAGTLPAHRAAEAALAGHVGLPAARLFPSAYAANLGLLGSLFGPEDLILSDSLNHASLIDGCRLSRARVVVYRHGDLDHLRELLGAARPQARTAAIVTETVFSMDGDLADVPALRGVASAHDAALVVDEAHALGLVGGRGAGLCAESGVRPDVLLGGLGKAFGLAGGFLAGTDALGRAIDNFARTFVFSTAILPAIAHAIPTALHLLQGADEPRRTLQRHATQLREMGRRTGRKVLGTSPAAIIPVVLGGSEEAVRASRRLHERGFLVPAMRPPTVPIGTARLRITPSALHTASEISSLCAALVQVLG